MVRGTREMAVAFALGAVTLLGGCKKSDNNAADTTAAMSAADTGMKAGTGSSTSVNNGMTNTGAANTANASKMTDADIFAMAAAANEGEVAAGKMAEAKATNASVKAFARDMVTDHGRMLSQGNALAKKLNITPNTAAADSITKANQTMASTLTSTAKGAAFDSAYVNGQVTGHQNTLDMIKSAEGQAQNAQLKSMLTSAQATVQRHLDRIKNIQGKMK